MRKRVIKRVKQNTKAKMLFNTHHISKNKNKEEEEKIKEECMEKLIGQAWEFNEKFLKNLEENNIEIDIQLPEENMILKTDCLLVLAAKTNEKLTEIIAEQIGKNFEEQFKYFAEKYSEEVKNIIETKILMANWPAYKKIYKKQMTEVFDRVKNEFLNLSNTLLNELITDCFTKNNKIFSKFFIRKLKLFISQTENKADYSKLTKYNLDNLNITFILDRKIKNIIIKCDDLYLNLEEEIEKINSEKSENCEEISTDKENINKYIASSRELTSIAEANGFVYKRANGDHGIFQHSKSNKCLIIPQGRDIGKGLSMLIQKNIMNYQM